MCFEITNFEYDIVVINISIDYFLFKYLYSREAAWQKGIEVALYFYVEAILRVFLFIFM